MSLHANRVLRCVRRIALQTLAMGAIVVAPGTRAYAEQTERQPPVERRAAEQPKSKSATPARTDRYGDPLPAGTLARLGTLRLRVIGAQMGLS